MESPPGDCGCQGVGDAHSCMCAGSSHLGKLYQDPYGCSPRPELFPCFPPCAIELFNCAKNIVYGVIFSTTSPNSCCSHAATSERWHASGSRSTQSSPITFASSPIS